MSRPANHTVRRRRAHLGLLLVCALGLVLRGTPPAAEASIALEASPPARIAEFLADRDPNLSPAERERIAEAIARYSAKYELDPELVTAVMWVESSGRPWAKSPKGARGLMQVMPYMIRPMGMAGNLSTIETNVEAGCIILAGNITRLGEAKGVSAYFWGTNIRGDGYLRRVEAARADLRLARSS